MRCATYYQSKKSQLLIAQQTILVELLQNVSEIKVGIRNIGDFAIKSSSMFVRVTFHELVTVFVFCLRG